MTYVDSPQRDDYTATSGQTVFAYTFRILTDAELKVYDDGILQTLATHYTVSGAGDAGGGNVTFVTGVTLSNKVILIRDTSDTQNTDYTVSGVFPAESHETALDKLTMKGQDLDEKLSRAVKFPITSSSSDVDFPELVAGKIVGVDTAGTGLELKTATVVDAVSVIATKGDIVQGDASGDATKLAIGSTGGILHVVSGLLAYLGIGSSGQLLTVSSGAPAWVDAATVAGAAKNKIINGGMSVAQRGTSFTGGTANADDVYTLDRWNLVSDGSDIVDVTQQSSGGVSGEEDYIRLDVETTAKKFGIVQFIETANLKDVKDESQVVSLSFEAKVTNATKMSDIRASVLSWTSTADAVTSDIVSSWEAEGSNPTYATNWTVENTAVSLGVTTSWVRYTIENIAIDASGIENLAVFIYQNNVATNDTTGIFLEITNVQLEKGTTANTFESRDIATEIAICKRYANMIVFEQDSVTFAVGNNTGAATAGEWVYYMPVQMRTTPTLEISAATDFDVSVAGSSGNVSALAIGNGNENVIHFTTTHASTGASGNGGRLRSTNTNATCLLTADF